MAHIDPAAVTNRTRLDDESWVDVTRGWVVGADEVLEALVADVAWRQGSIFRYDHRVDEPRLGFWWRPGEPPPHPLLIDAHRTLQHSLRKRFDGCGLALYRDGTDSVAFHRDREMKWLDETVVALVVLGRRRPFLLAPHGSSRDSDDAGSEIIDLAPGSGDLIVMGGACQRGWVHAVPKVRGLQGARVSLQWRWSSRTGPQERGGSYRKPLRYGSGRRG